MAAERTHRICDVAVAGTVTNEPTFFEGRRTHAAHEEFSIVTQHGARLDIIDNVDLAPQIPVEPGDVVVVKGQLIPKPGGGVVHDTHHRAGPGFHRGGWIEWRGVRFD